MVQVVAVVVVLGRIKGGFSEDGLGDLVRKLVDLPEIVRGGAIATTGCGCSGGRVCR